MPDGRHLVLIFHDISSDWNGQIGGISLRGHKLHRITNDLNAYSNLTLGVTRDGKQLIAIQVSPQAGVYTLSSDPNWQAPAKLRSTIMVISTLAGCRTDACWRWTTKVTSP